MEANRSKKHLLKYPYLIRWSCLKWPEYPIKNSNNRKNRKWNSNYDGNGLAGQF